MDLRLRSLHTMEVRTTGPGPRSPGRGRTSFRWIVLALAACASLAPSGAFAAGKLSLYVGRMVPSDVDAGRFSRSSWGGGISGVLPWPAAHRLLALTAGLRSMSDELTARGIVSAFAFAPADDIGLATAYIAAGFRKTGLLASGIYVGGQRKDAILWTRKLANPADEDAPAAPAV